jgi:hypothetical protein
VYTPILRIVKREYCGEIKNISLLTQIFPVTSASPEASIAGLHLTSDVNLPFADKSPRPTARAFGAALLRGVARRVDATSRAKRSPPIAFDPTTADKSSLTTPLDQSTADKSSLTAPFDPSTVH